MTNTDNDNYYEKADSVTVGVITHKGSYQYLNNFLELLSIPLQKYQIWSDKSVELVLVNNSGVEHNHTVKSILSGSSILDTCTCTLLDSPQNNIATGRNIVLDNSKYRLVAFIDDDEIPTERWLIELATIFLKHQCAVVTAPVHPKFPENTQRWLKELDLHNTTGNCGLRKHHFMKQFPKNGHRLDTF